MRQSAFVAGVIASAMLLCAPYAAGAAGQAAGGANSDTLAQIQQQLDALRKQDTYKVTPGSIPIETWLLTATAVDATAEKIRKAVGDDIKDGRVLVVAAAEPLDFGKPVMLKTEIQALTLAIHEQCECSIPHNAAPVPIAFAGALAGLLKTETEVTGVSQTVDAKLLAAAVAGKFANGIVPSAAVAADADGALMNSFKELVRLAQVARTVHDKWANGTAAEKSKAEGLAKLLQQYDAFYTRVTTGDASGNVPLVTAAKLDEMLGENPHILRVNTEQAGGTLVKRSNLWTALGAESAFVSGGLVSSYELAEPKTGRMINAGIVTCRTALTSLKQVQDQSWKAPDRRQYDRTVVPAAACTTISFVHPRTG